MAASRSLATGHRPEIEGSPRPANRELGTEKREDHTMATLGLVEDWKGNVIAIHDERLPSGPLALQFYEGFPTPFLDKNYSTPRPDWITDELPGRLGYELERPFGEDPLPVTVSNWLRAEEDTVTMTTVVANQGDRIIDEIPLNPCLAFRHCPEMFDDAGERLFFRHKGEWKTWTQLRRYVHVGWHEKVQHFEVAGRRSRVPYLADGYDRAKWGTSPDRLDVSIAARVHPQSGLAIGITFDRSHSAAGNCNASHYCIHSTGLVSDLCPGDCRTRIGKIFFCPGGLDELWERYTNELTGLA